MYTKIYRYRQCYTGKSNSVYKKAKFRFPHYAKKVGVEIEIEIEIEVENEVGVEVEIEIEIEIENEIWRIISKKTR